MSSMEKCLQHFSFAHSVIWKLFVEDTQCIQHCAACLLECSWFLQFSHGDRYYSHSHTRFIAKNQKLVQNEDNMIWECLTERPSFIWNIRGGWDKSKGWVRRSILGHGRTHRAKRFTSIEALRQEGKSNTLYVNNFI